MGSPRKLLSPALLHSHFATKKLYKYYNFQLFPRRMKWWCLMMGLLCLQMAVFVQVTEAKGKDSDGDGTPDIDDVDDDNDGQIDSEDYDDDGDGIPDSEDEDHPDFDDENDEL